MKKNYMKITFLFLLVCTVCCSVESVRENMLIKGDSGYNFKESLSQWQKLKTRNGNSYEYTFLEESWTGHGSETIITVVKGKVTARSYAEFVVTEDGIKEVTFSYTETGAEIGSQSEGAAPLTMDELYKSCASGYLTVDPAASKVFFDTTEEGIMILCGYVPQGCVDDCYRGIRISHFSWI